MKTTEITGTLLDFECREVTPEEACIMCHLSSECKECCKTCNRKNGCQGQACSQPFRAKEGERLRTWLHLVRTVLPELKRFIPKEYRKKYNI